MAKAYYFEVKLRYGHVGNGKSIGINRYLRAEDTNSYKEATASIINEVIEMPGTKKGFGSILSLKKIDYDEYRQGKKRENNNFFIQKLKNHHKTSA